MGKSIKVHLKVRRYDLHENPDFETVAFEIDDSIEYQTLKKFLYKNFDINQNEFAIKLRNADHCLIPLGELLNENTNNFIMDITKIKCTDAHVAALNKKITILLERLNQVEELAKDIEWQKQINTEDKINILTDKVEFLNRRFDQLLPTDVKQKQQTSL